MGLRFDGAAASTLRWRGRAVSRLMRGGAELWAGVFDPVHLRDFTVPNGVQAGALKDITVETLPAGVTYDANTVTIASGFAGDGEIAGKVSFSRWDIGQRDLVVAGAEIDIISDVPLIGVTRDPVMTLQANSAVGVIEYCTFAGRSDWTGAGDVYVPQRRVVQSGSGASLGYFGEMRYCRFGPSMGDHLKPYGAADGSLQTVRRCYFGVFGGPPEWSAGTSYDTGDWYIHEGRAYRSLVDGNIGNEPVDQTTDAYHAYEDVHADNVTVDHSAAGGVLVTECLIDNGPQAPGLPAVPVFRSNNCLRIQGVYTDFIGPVTISKNVMFRSAEIPSFPMQVISTGGGKPIGEISIIDNRITQLCPAGVALYNVSPNERPPYIDVWSGNTDVDTGEPITVTGLRERATSAITIADQLQAGNALGYEPVIHDDGIAKIRRLGLGVTSLSRIPLSGTSNPGASIEGRAVDDDGSSNPSTWRALVDASGDPVTADGSGNWVGFLPAEDASEEWRLPEVREAAAPGTVAQGTGFGVGTVVFWQAQSDDYHPTHFAGVLPSGFIVTDTERVQIVTGRYQSTDEAVIPMDPATDISVYMAGNGADGGARSGINHAGVKAIAQTLIEGSSGRKWCVIVSHVSGTNLEQVVNDSDAAEIGPGDDLVRIWNDDVHLVEAADPYLNLAGGDRLKAGIFIYATTTAGSQDMINRYMGLITGVDPSGDPITVPGSYDGVTIDHLMSELIDFDHARIGFRPTYNQNQTQDMVDLPGHAVYGDLVMPGPWSSRTGARIGGGVNGNWADQHDGSLSEYGTFQGGAYGALHLLQINGDMADWQGTKIDDDAVVTFQPEIDGSQRDDAILITHPTISYTTAQLQLDGTRYASNGGSGAWPSAAEPAGTWRDGDLRWRMFSANDAPLNRVFIVNPATGALATEGAILILKNDATPNGGPSGVPGGGSDWLDTDVVKWLDTSISYSMTEDDFDDLAQLRSLCGALTGFSWIKSQPYSYVEADTTLANTITPPATGVTVDVRIAAATASGNTLHTEDNNVGSGTFTGGAVAVFISGRRPSNVTGMTFTTLTLGGVDLTGYLVASHDSANATCASFYLPAGVVSAGAHDLVAQFGESRSGTNYFVAEMSGEHADQSGVASQAFGTAAAGYDNGSTSTPPNYAGSPILYSMGGNYDPLPITLDADTDELATASSGGGNNEFSSSLFIRRTPSPAASAVSWTFDSTVDRRAFLLLEVRGA